MNTQGEHVVNRKESCGAWQLRMHRDELESWPAKCHKLGISKERETAFARGYLQLRSDSVHYEAVYRAARQRVYELHAEYDTVIEERRRLYAELPDRLIERVSGDRDIAGITVYLASQIFDVRLRRSKCCSDIDEQTVVWRHNRKLMHDADEAADRMLDGYDLRWWVPVGRGR